MTFESQTVHLPCAMQSMNFIQATSDQLTLILWYFDTIQSSIRPLNASAPPIYSIDFRNIDDRKKVNSQQQNAIHFISNGQFKDRILFEFNNCQSYRNNFSILKTFNQTMQNNAKNYKLSTLNYHSNQFNTSNYLINKPICAFLKLNQIKKSDSGRYSCRLDFRRSRTLHTSVLLKVLGRLLAFDLI